MKTLSQKLADDLIRRDSSIRTKGFRQSLLAHIDGAANNLPSFRIIPDAYKVDPSSKTVTIYEIEDTHPVSIGKMASVYFTQTSLEVGGPYV